MAIAALSKNLQNVYSFENGFAKWGDGDNVLNHVCFIDKDGHYRKEILSGNWQATTEQKLLMLTYPETSIALKE